MKRKAKYPYMVVTTDSGEPREEIRGERVNKGTNLN